MKLHLKCIQSHRALLFTKECFIKMQVNSQKSVLEVILSATSQCSTIFFNRKKEIIIIKSKEARNNSRKGLSEVENRALYS